MIKEIIATGVDANAAIESGALLLGLPREEVQFEIIDLPRKGGFLGLKKLPAKVRVWVELPDEKPARSEKPRRQEAPRRCDLWGKHSHTDYDQRQYRKKGKLLIFFKYFR